MFENRGSQSTVAVRGNPDLAPETNISYQAAVQHLFSKDVSGQFAVFFKDIFGLIAVRQEVDPLTGLLVPHHPGDKVQLGWTDASGQSHTTTISLGTGAPA